MYEVYMGKPKLMRDIRELDQWREIPCLRMGRLHTVKKSILLNLIYGLRAIQIKIPAIHFVDIDKLFLKFKRQGKRPKIADTVVKINKVGGLTLSDFKTT